MMQWSCPHCRAQLVTSQNDLGSGWSFSRCAHCTGYSLIRKTEINVIRVDKAPPGEKLIPSQLWKSESKNTEPSISAHPISTHPNASPQTHPVSAFDLAQQLHEKKQKSITPPPFIHPHPPNHLKENADPLSTSVASKQALTLPPIQNLNLEKPSSKGLDFNSAAIPAQEEAAIPSFSPPEGTKTLSDITLSISGTHFPEHELRSRIQSQNLSQHSPSSHQASRSKPYALLALIGILTGSLVILNQKTFIPNEASPEAILTDQVKETALAPVPSTDQSKKWVETQKEMVNAYNGPGSHFAVVTQLAPYTLYEVIEIQDSWLKINLDRLPPELKLKAAWVPAQQVHFKSE
jgi:hypothetical protein